MPLNTSLADFNRIASGKYNAGQIDIQRDAQGNEVLVKVNNHRWKSSKNNVLLAPERILAVKQAFLAALRRGGVSEENLAEIRARLGLPLTQELLRKRGEKGTMLRARFEPLTRAQVRAILDQYAARGTGMTQETWNEMDPENFRKGFETAHMGAKRTAIQERINHAARNFYQQHLLSDGSSVFEMSDVHGLLSTTLSLASLQRTRLRRLDAAPTDADRRNARTRLAQEFRGLFSAVFKLHTTPALQESGEFWLANQQVKLVRGEDGKLSALVGTGDLQTKIDLKADAEAMLNRLIGRMAADKDTLGATAVKGLLAMVYDHDLEGGLLANDRTSLVRQTAALLVARTSGVRMDAILNGNFNTGVLVDIAEKILDGDVINGAEELRTYHDRMVRDSADLPEDIKRILEGVANVPLEKTEKGALIVQAPIVAELNEVAPVPPAPPMPYVAPLAGVPIDAIKDFVADLVFSNETMVADVVVNRPGETMRKMLSDYERMKAFVAILKNPDVLDPAVAPQILPVVKEGFAKMAAALEPAWQAAHNGQTFAQARETEDFGKQFAAFFQNAQSLPGADIAKFDNIIQVMANKGCESIQAFVNSIFRINAGQANAIGALTNEPYKNMTAQQIKAQLDAKNLNQILDAASNSDVPGQVGFFKQVLSTYFTSLGKADRRSVFAAAMRYAQNFDLGDKQGAEREEANKIAVNKFTGAILKGAGPLLHKMMQGLPRDIMGEFSDALNDMKSSLAPIPSKIVQGYLMQLVNESNGHIRSITMEKSLGAASVGETFLCKVQLFTGQEPKKVRIQGIDGRPAYQEVKDENGQPVMEDTFETKLVVVKIMRHDAERRMRAEAEIFNAAAAKIPGMSKTWEGLLHQYEQEFDFTHEAANINEGVELYDISEGKNPELHAIAPHVSCMKLSNLAAPKRDILVLEQVIGHTLDKFFANNTEEVRSKMAYLYQRVPGGKRLQWKARPGSGKLLPVLKPDYTALTINQARTWLAYDQSSITNAQKHLLEASKAWFYEALFGSGKFHGDTHSGNLMNSAGSVTFIDFGNLYKLKEQNDAGKNEKHELLRVILGATFRDKDFILTGFANLLSPEGRATLEANRDKAEAILNSVLAKGGFSQDIVYRLNAAIAELQKLGLELPPQINCFVQSMMRMANTVTEMNTIIKQMAALLDPEAWNIPGNPPQRDELDLLGKIRDAYAGSANDPRNAPKNNASLPGVDERMSAADFGGDVQQANTFFAAGGEYHNKVLQRLTGAQDPVQVATELCDMFKANLTPVEANYILDNDRRRSLDDALNALRNALARNPSAEQRSAAILAFTEAYVYNVKTAVTGIRFEEFSIKDLHIETPATFASALMDLLLDNFDADILGQIFSFRETMKLMSDAAAINKELPGHGFFNTNSSILENLKADAANASSDKDSSYKIDIGI